MLRNIELHMVKNGNIQLFHETIQTAIDDTKEELPIEIKKPNVPIYMQLEFTADNATNKT